MNKLQFKGTWNEIKGKLKQSYGDLTDDDLVFADDLVGAVFEDEAVIDLDAGNAGFEWEPGLVSLVVAALGVRDGEAKACRRAE